MPSPVDAADSDSTRTPVVNVGGHPPELLKLVQQWWSETARSVPGHSNALIKVEDNFVLCVPAAMREDTIDFVYEAWRRHFRAGLLILPHTEWIHEREDASG
jgi:hypothetical protein